MLREELQDRKGVEKMVDRFYERVRHDELLGPVFEKVIADRWPEHLEKMYRFWDTVLFAETSYKGSPFAKHADLPIDGEHFKRWIELFYGTIDELFAGEKAEELKWRAKKMAEMFEHKLAYLRSHPNSRLL